MDDANLTDAEFEAATERGRQFERENPKATAVRYEAASGRLVIDFANGSTFLLPARSLQDLSDASDDDLAQVALERDYYIRWDRLDVDFTIPGLLSGIFGTASFMEAQRRGGQSRSPAKAAAARANGAKGGRPRKTPSAA
jgi:hypothetical protein